jgi:hypothetical protein
MVMRSVPSGESKNPSRTALGQRLAETRSRRDPGRPAGRARSRGSHTWDLAAAAGISPGLMMAAIAIGGVGLALLAFGGVGAALRSDRIEAAEALPAEAAYSQPEVEIAAPMAAAPAEAIEDYYILLRQGMYDVAWSRTTGEFQQVNYPAGYPAYTQAWYGMKEIEVLSSSVVWQNRQEASIVAELRDTNTDRLFKNAYVLRFDPDSGLWRIESITPVW